MQIGASKPDVLRVTNLSKAFVLERSFIGRMGDWFLGKPPQKLRALDGVSFSVFERETVGILGESGSGKSTLARVLMGLHRADSGTASLLGSDLLNTSKSDRLQTLRRIQMIFQDPFGSLDPRMNVRQILSEPLIIHKITPSPSLEECLKTALGEVGLDHDVIGRYPSEFSGGQRQRIGICRALILDPVLIIADEAVSALDVSVQAQILELLVKLKEKRKLSLIFISHDVAVVRQLADRILILFQGRIVESLPADCLLKDVVHPYSRKLVSAALKLREGIEQPVIQSEKSETGEGCLLRGSCERVGDDCRKFPELQEIHENHFAACWNPPNA